jgi:N-acetylglucosamine kinase-like BadF-type ATPase
MREKEQSQYVIGVDAGGTTAVAALADLKGRILALGKTAASANPRNVGIEKAAKSVSEGINRVLKKFFGQPGWKLKNGKILSVFIGMPALAEEYQDKNKKKEIRRKISQKIPKFVRNKLKLGSDQLVAFRTGTDQKEGIVLITGTGCVAHGWKNGLEAKASGWGWLADEGSGFWIGQKIFQAVLKDMDGRGPKTALTELLLKKLKVDSIEKLVQKIYGENMVELISSLALLAEKESSKDKTARFILKEAGKEAALAFSAVVRRLRFQKKRFPAVLSGSVCLSDYFLKVFRFYAKKTAPWADFIILENKPVQGAVKLALENRIYYES